MTNPNTGPGGPGAPIPPSGPGAPPRGGPPPLTYAQKQALLKQQQLAAQAQTRANMLPGVFTDLHLEKLRMLGGSGLMNPRTERGAPLAAQVGDSQYFIVDMVVEQGKPEFWVRYLFDEIVNDKSKTELVGFPKRELLLDFYNRSFVRPDDFDSLARPYVIPRGRTILENYPPGITGEVLLRMHFRAAMELGFDWMQFGNKDNGHTNSSSMLHAVEHIMRIKKKTQHTPLVWRTEDSRTMRDLRSPGFTQQTTVEHRITVLGMDKTWNPYSTEEVRGRLWYRRQNTDNCLYTGISVALNPYASLVFPKITLSPTTLSPVANAVSSGLALGHSIESILCDQQGVVKKQFAPHIARLTLPGNVMQYALYSRARTILMALEGRYLDTQGVQAVGSGAGNRSQSFPEYGSVGIKGKNIFAQIELHRFFHTWRDDEGFTAFVNRPNCDIVGREEIVEAFVEEKAKTEYFQKVNSTYEDLMNGGPYGLAWTAGGMGYDKKPAQFANAISAEVNGVRIALR